VNYDGLCSEELSHRLGGTPCHVVARVTSALDAIHGMAREGAAAGTLVLADEQTAGRGRLSRRWLSPPSQGIWLGYLVRPECAIAGGVLAIRVGLVVLGALTELCVKGAIKWPNDLMVRNRKLAGVLCEVRSGEDSKQWVAVGIGMNVHGPIAPEIAADAIALEEAVPQITRVAVLEKLVPPLHRLSEAPVLDLAERDRYRRNDWLAGRRLAGPVAGIASGIDADGALLVRTRLRTERVLGGSVVTA
jgi:BirA family biotin operon repressor/biotin-[acetyl-CoA-carboxylase] ligase